MTHGSEAVVSSYLAQVTFRGDPFFLVEDFHDGMLRQNQCCMKLGLIREHAISVALVMSTTTAYDDFANIDGCLNVIPGISHYRVGFGIVFAAVIATALFLLILVTAILFRFKHSKKQPIYGLLNLLNITQVIYLIPSVIVMLPCTFSSCPFYSNPAIVLLSLPDTFGFYASSTLNCLIAIERISMFLFTPLHYFVERHTIAYGSISWIIGLLVMFLTTFIGCYKRFNPYSIAFSYECGSCDLFKNVNLLTMLMWITQVMVIVMLIGYIVVVGSMKLKSSLRTKKRRFTRQEAGLLLQGGLICLCQWMVIVFFFDIRTILEDEPVVSFYGFSAFDI
uniref:G_PROTEIN_RECEP_F1_2 domain-containing protein n=1 Tax=Syphacia muris TaxID=451379 RepID=A0A0N5AG56_9BILA